MGFQFDIRNFALGLMAGWGTAIVAYRARAALASVRQTVTSQARQVQVAATRNADSRYLSDLVTLCQTNHLGGRLVNLTDIVVEPCFLAAPELVAPPDEDAMQDVFQIVPRVHDFPFLHAPYNVPFMTMEELGRGSRALALLGVPGSGRTTALMAIALWAVGRLEFERPHDNVQEMLNQEEASLRADERKKRIQDREYVEESARKKLAEQRGEGEEEDKVVVPVFQRLVPIYVHLGNVTVSPNEYGRQIDPAEPLVRAVQYQVKRVTAKTTPRNLYKLLNKGQALVLIDGYDDLPEQERLAKVPWLKAFLETYERNFIIVAGPASGYGGLTQAGLTPVFLRPWNDTDTRHAADRWADAWATLGGRRRSGSKPAPDLIMEAKVNNREMTPFDITMKLLAMYGGQAAGVTSEFRSYFSRVVSDFETHLPHMALAAALQLDTGYITAAHFDALLAGKMPSVVMEEMPWSDNSPDVKSLDRQHLHSQREINALFSGENADDEDSLFEGGKDDDALFESADEDVDSLFEDPIEDDSDALFESGSDADASGSETVSEPTLQQEATPDQMPVPQAEQSASKTAPEDKNLARIRAKLFSLLQSSGLLVAYRGNRYQFRHPMMASYLASLTLRDAGNEALAKKALQPNWAGAIGYAALHMPIDAAVNARLEAPSDMLQTHKLVAARWMAYADEEAEWRKPLLRTLGNLLIDPDQFALPRERLAAALVGTRDKGALVIFRRAARDPNPRLRQLACLAIGALGEVDGLNDLAALLQDQDGDVQIAAALGLGAVGTEEALQLMAETLADPSEDRKSERVRQAIAETFAGIPEEGYPVLYDAIKHEAMMLRRAAVFGLRRIYTGWSLVAIYRAMLEDKEWYVRSAAQQAFQDIQHAGSGIPKSYPPVEEIPWLQEWAGELDESERQEVSPDQMLVKALEQGAPEVQTLSAGALGQLGLAANVGVLYAALENDQSPVREAAYRALGDLQQQIGHPLPGVN